MPLGMEVCVGPGDFMLDGDPAPHPQRGWSPLPNFWPMSIEAKRLDASRCHLVWLRPVDFVLDGDPAPSPKRGQSPLPSFRGGCSAISVIYFQRATCGTSQTYIPNLDLDESRSIQPWMDLDPSTAGWIKIPLGYGAKPRPR